MFYQYEMLGTVCSVVSHSVCNLTVKLDRQLVDYDVARMGEITNPYELS